MPLLLAHSLRVMDSIPSATIFLVEEEVDLRKLMRNALRTAGYETLEAVTGELAMQRIAAYRGPIDLVVADFDAIRETQFQYRLSKARPGLPLLLCSGTSLEDILVNDCFDPSILFLKKSF